MGGGSSEVPETINYTLYLERATAMDPSYDLAAGVATVEDIGVTVKLTQLNTPILVYENLELSIEAIGWPVADLNGLSGGLAFTIDGTDGFVSWDGFADNKTAIEEYDNHIFTFWYTGLTRFDDENGYSIINARYVWCEVTEK